MECKQIGTLTGGVWDKMHEQSRRVYDKSGLSPALNTCGGGGHDIKIAEPTICASRGRNPENPTSRKAGEHVEQRIEIGPSGLSNTLTSVQKDNYVLEPQYRIRKLTPLECLRLMGFDDEDYEKVRAIGMSDSQIYRQAGNSIVVQVLEEIFKQML